MRLSKYSGPIIEMSGDFDDVILTNTDHVLRRPKNSLLPPSVVEDEPQVATTEVVELSFVSCGQVFDREIGFWVPEGEHPLDNLKSMMKQIKEFYCKYLECERQKKEIKNLNDKIVEYEAKLNRMTKNIKKLSGEDLQDWLVNNYFREITIRNCVDANWSDYTECLISANHPREETIKADKWEIMQFIDFKLGDSFPKVKESVEKAVLKRENAEKKRREEKAEINRIVRKVAELKAKGIDIDALGQEKNA